MLFCRTDQFAVQMIAATLFCFIFLLNISQGDSSTTPKLISTPHSVSRSQIISGNVVGNTTSPALTTSTIHINSTSPILLSSIKASSEKPARSTTSKPPKKESGRKFDGLSFFGGIILGAAICIILLFSVKYYQAKKRSYHSL